MNSPREFTNEKLGRCSEWSTAQRDWLHSLCSPSITSRGRRMKAGSAEACSNSTVCKRLTKEKQTNCRATMCTGLSAACPAQLPAHAWVHGFVLLSSSKQAVMRTHAPYASEAESHRSLSPDPAVCTCRDSSSHKTNRAAKHTAERALPGRWKVMGGAGHGGLPEWQGLQA